MSLKSFIKKIIGSPAGQSVERFALSETQKAVAALKKTQIGSAVASDIAALTNSSLSNSEKFEQVVVTTAPLIISFLTTKGAIGLALSDVESVARELVQSTFNDTKSTKAGTFASLVLKLLGLA